MTDTNAPTPINPENPVPYGQAFPVVGSPDIIQEGAIILGSSAKGNKTILQVLAVADAIDAGIKTAYPGQVVAFVKRLADGNHL